MIKEDFNKALNIFIKHRVTVEFLPVLKGRVLSDNSIALQEACPAVIEDLVISGYMLNLQEGKIFVDKL